MSSVLAIQPADPLATHAPASLPLGALAHSSSRRRADEIQFLVVSLVTFPVFLVASLVGRLITINRQAAPRTRRESLSVIQEAKASAQTCGSFSLMG